MELIKNFFLELIRIFRFDVCDLFIQYCLLPNIATKLSQQIPYSYSFGSLILSNFQRGTFPSLAYHTHLPFPPLTLFKPLSKLSPLSPYQFHFLSSSKEKSNPIYGTVFQVTGQQEATINVLCVNLDNTSLHCTVCFGCMDANLQLCGHT